VYGKGRK